MEVDKIEEFRTRLTERARLMLRRPNMFAACDQDVDVRLHELFDDIQVLAGQEPQQYGPDHWRSRYGKLGVAGAFRGTFGTDRRYHNEVASVWAEHYARGGLIELPEPPVRSAEWHARIVGIDETDLTKSGLLELLGPPTLEVGGTVLCYDQGATASGAPGWVFADFDHLDHDRYDTEQGIFVREKLSDPLLRCVRLPGGRFVDSLVLTRLGKAQRFGRGWWIDHSSDLDPEEAEIAGQLREIRDSDPSQ